MEEQFFRTGDVAKQLKTTAHLVRRLCETGQIKSRLTASGRRLICASEIARLNRDGFPPARSVPMNDPDSGSEGELKKPKIPRPLIGSPSDEIVKSSEAVLKARNNVEIRRAERELEEAQLLVRTAITTEGFAVPPKANCQGLARATTN